ncbi:NusG domain II-containing protein [Paludicola sp. MB14-C6]|uniref:NusG domain II-containing protein n=1 Tax=Paludihabitans sp. MB14-C6 TaxID=3070656 RepID=UPI0027DDBB01|nr:NusG domain II-containing protein [Paludicola sp. MB14-C6]WMJ24202.1 NusG domain II-containing protein [Paludicola sp. MB14-C6]
MFQIKDKQKFVTIVFIVVVLLIAGVLFLAFELQKEKDSPMQYAVARVSIDGANVEYINLTLQEDGVIDLKPKYHVPVQLQIKNHAICFHNVTCPDKICEKAGYLKKDMDMAVCMPNKTVVRVELMSKQEWEKQKH